MLKIKNPIENLKNKILGKNRNKEEISQFEKQYPVREYLKQNGLEIESTYIKHLNKYSRTYYLTGLPKIQTPDDIISAFALNDKKLFDKDFNFTVKINIRVIDSILLEKSIKTTKANIKNESEVPVFGGSEVKANEEINNIEEVEQKIARGQELTDTSIVLSVFAESLELLNQIDAHVQARFRQKKWTFTAPLAGQKNAYLNSLPLPCVDTPSLKILSESLAPMILPTSGRTAGLLPIGYDLYRRNVYFWDIFLGDRVHTIVIAGRNGTGKSAFCKKLFEETGMVGVQRWYIDSEGECSKLAKAMGAHVINVNKSTGGINIIDYNDKIYRYFDEEDRKKYDPMSDHINWLANFLLRFPVWNSNLQINKSPLFKCLKDFYLGIGKDRKNRNMYELCDFIKKNDSKYNLWNSFINFSEEEHGTYSLIFSNKEEFNLEYDAIIFDVSGNNDEQIRQALGYVLLYKTFDQMLPKDRYRGLFIDELHMFLQFEGFKDLLTQYIKRARKYNGFYVLINQQLNDYQKYNAMSIVPEAGFVVSFQQDKISSDVLKLSEEQYTIIKQLPDHNAVIYRSGGTTFDRIKTYLRPYQVEYSAKDNPKNLSIDMMRRFKPQSKIN